MSLPKTYKAAVVQVANGPFEIVERELQTPKAGEVLVKVLACGVCQGDGLAKTGHVPLPRTPGHEVIGDIVSVPSGESHWKVGDRVGAGWHGGHCNQCSSCTAGDFVTCENAGINGIKSDGGFAEYMLVRTQSLISVPTDMDPAEAAPLVCAGVTMFNSLRNTDVKAGEIVAVQGIGGLGHLGIQYANKMGFRTVALSSSDSKRQFCMDLGAQDYIDGSKVDQAAALRKLGGAKVVMCTAPNAEVIAKLLPGMAVGGTILILAAAENLVIPHTGPLLQKRISIRGWPSGSARDSQDTISFSNMKGVKCMVQRFKLEDVNVAYENMITSKARFRSVLVF